MIALLMFDVEQVTVEVWINAKENTKRVKNPEGHEKGFEYLNSHTHPADFHVMNIESKDGSGSNAKYCIREGGWNGKCNSRCGTKS